MPSFERHTQSKASSPYDAHGRLNPSSGTTNANLTGIAPALATSSADPVADKVADYTIDLFAIVSILAGFAMRKRGAIRSSPSIRVNKLELSF